MTTLATPPSTARLNFRLRPDLKQLIERAAAIMGHSVTEYAVSRLVEAARQDVRAHEETVLSDRDRDLFLALLASDAEPNEAMRRAAGRYKERRVSDG